VYKPTPKLKLQCETELERTSSILTIQNLIYNPYIFKVVMPLSYIPGVSLFIKTNVTDFLKRFKDMLINYGFSDDRKIQRV